MRGKRVSVRRGGRRGRRARRTLTKAVFCRARIRRESVRRTERTRGGERERRTHVKVSLGADLEADLRALDLGVVDGLGAGLDVLRNLVVVRRREDGQVGEAVDGDGVRRRGVAEAERVARDGARRDRVGRLGTEKESVAADDLRASERRRQAQERGGSEGGEGERDARRRR